MTNVNDTTDNVERDSVQIICKDSTIFISTYRDILSKPKRARQSKTALLFISPQKRQEQPIITNIVLKHDQNFIKMTENATHSIT